MNTLERLVVAAMLEMMVASGCKSTNENIEDTSTKNPPTSGYGDDACGIPFDTANFYVTLADPSISIHHPDAFKLAEAYFRNDVGVPIRFIMYPREQVLPVELNHTTDFLVMEAPPLNLAPGLDLSSYGKADPKISTIFLYTRPAQGFPGESPEQRRGHLSIKRSAKIIAHEVGHLFGLWHSDIFVDDAIEDFVGETANMMSYEELEEGPYGFDLNPEQKRLVREYFCRGSIFDIMRDAGFNIETYTRTVKNFYDFRWGYTYTRGINIIL